MTGILEMGTTSLRMVVAEIPAGGHARVVESLHQPVMLGRDAFTLGYIKQETIEECVAVLRTFKEVMKTYKISGPSGVFCFATSAIREASNRETVLDRIYVATGLDVSYLEDSVLSRYTYNAVLPYLKSFKALEKENVLVLEVGGGSTDVLQIHDGNVGGAAVFKLGSYRIRRLLEEQMSPAGKLISIMRDHIARSVSQIRDVISCTGREPVILALGGDARLAALTSHPKWDMKKPVRVRTSALLDFANDLTKLDRDKMVRKYNMSYPDAETLVPALLSYAAIAESFGRKSIFVCGASLRDGILREIAESSLWEEEFRKQMRSAALAVGRKYDFDEGHAERVEGISRSLFLLMKDEHQLDSRTEVILSLASLLHDIGHFVSNRSHHKHSMYLISNSDLFGFSSREILLAAVVARYHRKSLPRITHEVYGTLGRDERVTVGKLAAFLRIADALDVARSSWLINPEFQLEPGALAIIVDKSGHDLASGDFGLREKGTLFEQVYGRKVVLKHRQAGINAV
jgi:exopolyphosphatase/guanosine-5'-triphosphate,3'-diphosphate pyrophosphatase